LANAESGRILFWDAESACLQVEKKPVFFYASQGSFHVGLTDEFSPSQVRFESFHNELSVYAHGYYLSLPSDRVEDMTMVRGKGDYEKFLLLDLEAYRALDCIKRNGFWSANYERFIEAGQIEVTHGVLRYLDSNVEIRRNAHMRLRHKDNILLYNDSNFDRINIFNPLIYFCCFGNAKYLDMLNVFLASLMRFGNVTPDLVLLTDLPEDRVRLSLNAYEPFWKFRDERFCVA